MVGERGDRGLQGHCFCVSELAPERCEAVLKAYGTNAVSQQTSPGRNDPPWLIEGALEGEAFGRVNSLRSKITHDWLDHQVLPALRQRGERPPTTVGDEPIPPVIAAIPEWIAEARRFATLALEGYGPRQIVGLRLEAACEDHLGTVEEAIHDAYLRLQVIQPRIAELSRLLDRLEKTARALIDGWSREPWPQAGCRTLKGLLLRLRSLLAAFPDGIVLP